MSYNRDMPTGNCQKCINTFGTLGCCDTVSNEWRYNCDDGMRQFDERKPQTNYDRLVSKTPEELAEWLNDNDSNFPISDGGGHWLSWLNSPVEVGDEIEPPKADTVPMTHADQIRQMTDEGIEDWYWWMHKEMMRYTDSRIFVHDWLKSPVEVEE